MKDDFPLLPSSVTGLLYFLFLRKNSGQNNLSFYEPTSLVLLVTLKCFCLKFWMLTEGRWDYCRYFVNIVSMTLRKGNLQFIVISYSEYCSCCTSYEQIILILKVYCNSNYLDFNCHLIFPMIDNNYYLVYLDYCLFNHVLLLTSGFALGL